MVRLKPLHLFACLALLFVGFSQRVTALTPVPAVHARSLMFSPDGKLVAAVGVPYKRGQGGIETNHVARVWTVADGKPYRHYQWAEAHGEGMAFSPDSQFLALVDQRQIKIVYLPTNQIHFTLDHQIEVERLSFSPDGRWLIIQGPWVSEKDAGQQGPGHRDFEVWQLIIGDDAPKQRKQRLTQRDFNIQYSPSGPQIVESATPPIPTPCDPTATALNTWNMKFSTDGKWQLITRKDTNATQLWDATTCTLKNTFAVPEDAAPRPSWIFSPKNHWLLGGRGGQLYLWNLDQGTMLDLKPDLGFYNAGGFEYLGNISTFQRGFIAPELALSPDERYIAISRGLSEYTNDNPIFRVYDMTTGQPVATMY